MLINTDPTPKDTNAGHLCCNISDDGTEGLLKTYHNTLHSIDWCDEAADDRFRLIVIHEHSRGAVETLLSLTVYVIQCMTCSHVMKLLWSVFELRVCRYLKNASLIFLTLYLNCKLAIFNKNLLMFLYASLYDNISYICGNRYSQLCGKTNYDYDYILNI